MIQKKKQAVIKERDAKAKAILAAAGDDTAAKLPEVPSLLQTPKEDEDILF